MTDINGWNINTNFIHTDPQTVIKTRIQDNYVLSFNTAEFEQPHALSDDPTKDIRGPQLLRTTFHLTMIMNTDGETTELYQKADEFSQRATAMTDRLNSKRATGESRRFYIVQSISNLKTDRATDSVPNAQITATIEAREYIK